MEVKTTVGKLLHSFYICDEGLVDIIKHSKVSQKKCFSPYDLFYKAIENRIEYEHTSLKTIQKGFSTKPTYTLKEAFCMFYDMGERLETLYNYDSWQDIEIIITNSTINNLVDLYGYEEVLEAVCGELSYGHNEAYYELLKYIIIKHNLIDEPDIMEEIRDGEFDGPDIEEMWDLGASDLVGTLLNNYTNRKKYNEMITQIIKAILDE